MTSLETLIRNLVSTTLPLSLLACGGTAYEQKCTDPQTVQPPPASCSDDLFGRVIATVEVCGGGLPDSGFMPVGGPSSPPDCQALCRYSEYIFCKRVSTDGGATVVGCMIPACTGRRPPGLVLARRSAGAALGGFLAEAAYLEAASVVAFDDLGVELHMLGASRALRAAAANAAKDERRHARVMGLLARRHGGCIQPLRIGPRGKRCLEEIATDNAIEGCTRELYGAAVGLWQARTASDPQIRSAMAAIAGDELRHAEFSFALAAWARSRLDVRARRRVAAARRRAQDELEREAALQPAAELLGSAGIPPPAAALQLARGLRAAFATTAPAPRLRISARFS